MGKSVGKKLARKQRKDQAEKYANIQQGSRQERIKETSNEVCRKNANVSRNQGKGRKQKWQGLSKN